MGVCLGGKWEEMERTSPEHTAVFSSLVPTVGGARKEVLLLIGVPRNDLNEVGHKRRYQTLDDGRIAADHVLLVHVRLVVLSHDCGWRWMSW